MYPAGGGSGAGGIPSIPGDPGSLSSAAARLGATASAVRDWGSQLGSVASGLSGATWSGQGAVSFATCISRLEADHRSASAALADASSALSAYAAVMAECQAKVRAAQSQVVQAQAGASSALSQLNSQPLPPHDPGAAAARSYAASNIQNSMDQEIGLATSAAQAAWDQFEAAAARAAGQIASAIPSWSSISKDIGWLNDKAGFGLVPLGLGFLAPLGRAFVKGMQTGQVLDEYGDGWVAERMAPYTEMLDSGQIGAGEYEELEAAVMDRVAGVKMLFGKAAVDDIAAGGITPEMPFSGALTAGSRVLGGAAVGSDIAEIISPDDSGAVRGVDRGMAAANGVLSLDTAAGGAITETVGGVIGVDLTTGWVPVAGQVVLAGTALYLAGDWAYNNVKWFHDGVDDAGHALADAGEGIAHGAEDVGSGIAHGAEDVAHFFGL
jgi:uncharacterized protein YukE